VSWEPVIGLEIHAQLATRSKIFSGAATAYGAPPNTQACLVDLGYPGVLPVLNGEAVRLAVKFGLAIGAQIARRSVFARKNDFNPDLPKGYQISQYELPVVQGGSVTIVLEDGTQKTVRLTRAHLEEDAGKSLHESFHGQSGIDLNRAGTPLLEIVSEPDLRSAKEAAAYMRAVHQLVSEYLGICDGNLQEGSFRCDANVSVRRTGTERLGTRTETKNLNSFRFLERAIDFEIARQIEVLEEGGRIVQETRLYDPQRDETRSMRSKEEANDYRYFPDPDLLPLEISEAFVEEVRSTLPELPGEKAARFRGQYALGPAEVALLTQGVRAADYFEAVVHASGADPKTVSNWVTVNVFALLNRDGRTIAEVPVSAAALAGLLKRTLDQTISGKIAKDVLEEMWSSGASADAIIEKKGLRQITDTGALEAAVDGVMAAHPGQLADYRAGKDKLFGFFVGQVMKATGGKGNPAQVNELLKRKLAG